MLMRVGEPGGEDLARNLRAGTALQVSRLLLPHRKTGLHPGPEYGNERDTTLARSSWRFASRSRLSECHP